jgi:hypothetical protein
MTYIVLKDFCFIKHCSCCLWDTDFEDGLGSPYIHLTADDESEMKQWLGEIEKLGANREVKRWIMKNVLVTRCSWNNLMAYTRHV